jgi:hypothetical protein
MKNNYYYVKMCKREYEKKKRLWCKIVLKISVKHTKGNEESYFNLYPFRVLAQRSFQGGLYVCIK